MMVVIEVSVVPLGTGSASLSRYVARCLEILDDSGVVYQLTPMGTILEGELELLLSLVRRMHEVPFDEGVVRVVTTIKIDDRRDKAITMAGKIRAVEAQLRQ
jgi:uncharacterized protein (TIGR00106 family)